MTSDQKLDKIITILDAHTKQLKDVSQSVKLTTNKILETEIALRSEIKETENKLSREIKVTEGTLRGEVKTSEDTLRSEIKVTEKKLSSEIKNTEEKLKDEIIVNRKLLVNTRDLLLAPIYSRLDKLEKQVFKSNYS